MKFCNNHNIVVSLPVTEVVLVNFLAFLFHAHYRVNTISAHVSALAYINKLFGFQDFSQSFLIKQFLKGANNLSREMSPCDTRLPITLEILRKIIHSLPHTISNYVYRVIFSIMCIFAFHGFLRIGEICCKTKEGSAVIQQDDIHAVYHDGRPVGIELKLKKYKHSSQAVTIFLPACSHDSAVCPVGAFQLYKNVVVGACGPFFQFPGGKAVPYSFFNANLHKVISFLGYDTSQYKSHSFRIGAATHAAIQGFSEESIQKMGRWKSNALQNYIRIPQLRLVN